MSTVTIIRHSKANSLKDELTPEGVEFAVGNRERFSGYSKVVCSPLNRSQQTAKALGYDKIIADERLREFIVDINTESAEAYVQEVHLNFAKELLKYGNELLNAIKYYGDQDCLLVSHNAVMSAAFYILTGDNSPFNNLSGFQTKVESSVITNPQKINIKLGEL